MLAVSTLHCLRGESSDPSQSICRPPPLRSDIHLPHTHPVERHPSSVGWYHATALVPAHQLARWCSCRLPTLNSASASSSRSCRLRRSRLLHESRGLAQLTALPTFPADVASPRWGLAEAQSPVQPRHACQPGCLCQRFHEPRLVRFHPVHSNPLRLEDVAEEQERGEAYERRGVSVDLCHRYRSWHPRRGCRVDPMTGVDSSSRRRSRPEESTPSGGNLGNAQISERHVGPTRSRS